jgi:curved DNA-binding protein CbpA
VSDRSNSAPNGESRTTGVQQDPVLAAYFANLEIPYGSDVATVKKAWKKMMKKYHPDLHSSDPDKRNVANRLCTELTHAYQELTRLLSE